MPTDTAMDTLRAYRLKQKQNPNADRTTLFKYILWDRFSGRLVPDAELTAMAESSASLAELAFAVLAREKPAMAEGRLAASARDAIRRFFEMNYPAGL
jgi:hypothetical protein